MGNCRGVVRTVLLDGLGAAEYRERHPWTATLRPLPYTLLLLNGQPVDGFATPSGAHLMKQIEVALIRQPW